MRAVARLHAAIGDGKSLDAGRSVVRGPRNRRSSGAVAAGTNGNSNRKENGSKGKDPGKGPRNGKGSKAKGKIGSKHGKGSDCDTDTDSESDDEEMEGEEDGELEAKADSDGEKSSDRKRGHTRSSSKQGAGGKARLVRDLSCVLIVARFQAPVGGSGTAAVVAKKPELPSAGGSRKRKQPSPAADDCSSSQLNAEQVQALQSIQQQQRALAAKAALIRGSPQLENSAPSVVGSPIKNGDPFAGYTFQIPTSFCVQLVVCCVVQRGGRW